LGGLGHEGDVLGDLGGSLGRFGHVAAHFGRRRSWLLNGASDGVRQVVDLGNHGAGLLDRLDCSLVSP
jgi:hypothetical protein